MKFSIDCVKENLEEWALSPYDASCLDKYRCFQLMFSMDASYLFQSEVWCDKTRIIRKKVILHIQSDIFICI